MAIEHVNRKGQRYFLQAISGKDGKPRYSFARKLKGQPVDAIPEGYEIYEEPGDAQVFLRKTPVSAILPQEKETVTEAVRRLSKAADFIVDVEKDALVVYVCESDGAEMEQRLGFFSGFPQSRIRQAAREWVRSAPYTKMMRFVLRDEKKRLFEVQRWCFSGSIDNWIFVKGSSSLVELAKAYAVHLGRESFLR